MIRKFLLGLLNYLANPKKVIAEINAKQEADFARQMKEIEEKFNPKTAIPPKIPEPSVKYDLDTGKITLPDNISPEERAELEAVMEEFRESLQQLSNDQFGSLEDFLKPNHKTGTAVTIPFTTANTLPDNQLQVVEEMLNHKADTEHWNDEDFVEHLLGFHNQGYKFDGLVEMYHKMNERVELSEEERKKLGQWYQLVSQELVYDV